jgi:hypothetical protein
VLTKERIVGLAARPACNFVVRLPGVRAHSSPMMASHAFMADGATRRGDLGISGEGRRATDDRFQCVIRLTSPVTLGSRDRETNIVTARAGAAPPGQDEGWCGGNAVAANAGGSICQATGCVPMSLRAAPSLAH